MNKYKKLNYNFYQNDTIVVARNLLGKYLFRKIRTGYLIGKIVETEAYLGIDDPACHASKKKTKRNEVMFCNGGVAYVYFIYGNYYCFNVVTEKEDYGSAVLIRAIEPIEGIEVMKRNRKNVKDEISLTNGPSKLCLAFEIDKKLNGEDLTEENIFIAEKKEKEQLIISVTKRIGITEGADLPYRFYIQGNKFVTKHKINKEIILNNKL